MSELKEYRDYIVTTRKGYSIKDIEFDLVRDTSQDSTVNSKIIPLRPVKISKPFPASNRNTQFSLTKEEVQQLRNDPRIEYIQKVIPIGETDLVTSSLESFQDFRIPGVWNRPEYLGGDINVAYQNPYATNPALKYMTTNENLSRANLPELHQSSPLSGSFGRTLNGEGVDLIIVDNVIGPYHQEFLRDPNVGIEGIEDPTNASRINFIKWFEYTNTEGVDPPNYNLSYPGIHGTQCASIAAGNVFGWAPKAELYFIKVNEGGDSSHYDYYDIFPLIKRFHEQKPIDPNTGFKRPTVVTVSVSLIHRPYQGLKDSTDNLTHIDQFYPTGSSAGLTGNNNTASLELGFPHLDVNKDPYLYPDELIHNKWVPSINADAEECSELGIIIVSAAGNRSMPMAGSGSTSDPFFLEEYYSPYWDSYYTYDEDNSRYGAGEPVYYHRANIPGGNSIVKVANVSFENLPWVGIRYINFGLVESSERGPRIDIGALSHTNAAIVGGQSAFHDLSITHSLYKVPVNTLNQAVMTNTYGGGTSFAAPQIAGMACLWKQINPEGNSTQFKKFLKENANPNSIESLDYPDGTNENGGLYYYRNYLTNVRNYSASPILPTAQYRNPNNRIQLANWPYSSPYTFQAPNIKISKS